MLHKEISPEEYGNDKEFFVSYNPPTENDAFSIDKAIRSLDCVFNFEEEYFIIPMRIPYIEYRHTYKDNIENLSANCRFAKKLCQMTTDLLEIDKIYMFYDILN